MIPRTRIKVCCVASLAEAREAVDAGADALGLVAEMPSGPGTIADNTIREIADQTPPPVATFLLTSRTDPVSVVEHVRYCGTGVVQLVDNVPRETYEALRVHCPAVKIVQVIHVLNEESIDAAGVASQNADALLLDSGKPNARVRTLGGTGEVHDWKLSAEIVKMSTVPVFLAGGLTAQNVAEAIQQVCPYGVDLCSGVRTRGALDKRKLREFVVAVLSTCG